jgi:hypothetical protein
MFNVRRTALAAACLCLIVAVGILNNLVLGIPISVLEDIADWVCGISVLLIFGIALSRHLHERHVRSSRAGEPDLRSHIPRDVVGEWSTAVALRRLVAGVTQFVLNDGGFCLRCWMPFAITRYHISSIEDRCEDKPGCHGTVIALCEKCFWHTTYEEKLRYYGQAMGNLVGKGMEPDVGRWEAAKKSLWNEHEGLRPLVKSEGSLAA